MPENPPENEKSPATTFSQPFVDQLVQDLAGVHWPAPAELRARARRRTLRVAVGAPVVVVLVLAGAGGIALVDRTRPDGGRPVEAPPVTVASGIPAPPSTGSAPASASAADRLPAPPDPEPATPPDRTAVRASGGAAWIPPEALLQPDDVGGDHQPRPAPTPAATAEPTWAFDLDAGCPGYAALKVTAPQRYRYIRSTEIVRELGADRRQRVRQEVARYADDTAGQVLADTRRVVAACPTFDDTSVTTTGGRPVVVTHRWAVRDDDFAGDESLLLRQEVASVDRGGPQPAATTTVVLYAVVRVDDLVAVVRSEDHSEPEVRRLGSRAAVRMCHAAAAGC